MQEDETPSGEFVETLRATAAAVGQPAAGRDFEQGVSAAEPSPDREARIAALKRQYAEGAYHVDAADVAARIVDDHLT
jgi:anti-sigma28 factor (negative regulator of flagellin synthesis)